MRQVPIGVAHDAADRLFEHHGAGFGADLARYRGHVHRVIGLVGLQVQVAEEHAEALGLAAFFHDSGIFLDHTWDYLPPSASRAVAALGGPTADHAGLVEAMITEHHRIRRARHPEAIVEAFRRADLTDVSAGLVRSPGAKRKDYRALVSEYPARGFRPMLLKAFGRGLKERPLHPLPMMKF